MKKPFSTLGDNWPEFFGNLLLLILIGPLYLFLCGLVLVWGFIGWLFRFPAPKQVPCVIADVNSSAQEKINLYVNQFKKEIPKIEVTTDQSDESVYLKTKYAMVQLWQDDSTVGIQLNGKDKKLDTGYWHTGEEEIDIFFWYAMAALKAGVQYEKNWFGRQIGWVYSEPMEIWMGVSTNAERYSTDFTRFARQKKGLSGKR